MKKFIITEEERSRILGMHKKSTSRHYLMEQACQNTEPTINQTPMPLVQPPAGFTTTAKGVFELPQGTYTLKDHTNGQLTGYYTIWDSTGCFTGYGVSLDPSKEGEFTQLIVNESNQGSLNDKYGNEGIELQWELKQNKYPKVQQGDQNIRN